MAANLRSLGNIQGVGYPTSPFKALNSLANTSLFGRINWVFGLYMGYLTAGASYCLYNVYKAYQLKCHISSGLDNQFKLAKCKVLFKEVQEKNNGEGVQPLLQECESLLGSITDNTCSLDKKELLLGLALYYAKNKNPERSYQITEQLSASNDLLNIAGNILQNNLDFATAKLNALFTRAYEANNQENQRLISPFKTPSMEIPRLLLLARAFHLLKNSELKNDCITKAVGLMKTLESDSEQIVALSRIVQCYQDIEEPGQIGSFIGSAQKLLIRNRAGVDLLQPRLVLAYILFSIGKFEKMDQELEEVVKLFEKEDPKTTVKELYSFAKFIKKIANNQKAESNFKNFAVEPLINTALQALARPESSTSEFEDRLYLSPEALYKIDVNRIEVYLSIASIYQEELLNNPDAKQQLIRYAFQEIQRLPESTEKELDSKRDLLTRLTYFCKQDLETAEKIMQILKGWYDQRTLPTSTSSTRWNKPEFGREILMLYYKIGLTKESQPFFKKYLSYIKDQKNEKAFIKISQLVTCAKLNGGEQTKALLEAAESLLPQLTSPNEYKSALSILIEGYLQVDRQKSLKLLESYEDQQANSYLMTASITAVAMGVLHFYPKAAPFLSLGLAAARLF